MTISELRRVAVLMRTLADVEHADAVGDSREVGRLLAGVDPGEVRTFADRASFEAGVRSLHVARDGMKKVPLLGRRRGWS